MADACKYFKFLSDSESLELMQQAENGISLHGIPIMNKDRYYRRLKKARQLGLMIKKQDGYYLTAMGELIMEKARMITELNPLEWMLKSIDRCPTEEERLDQIHQMFNKRPDIQEALTRKP